MGASVGTSVGTSVGALLDDGEGEGVVAAEGDGEGSIVVGASVVGLSVEAEPDCNARRLPDDELASSGLSTGSVTSLSSSPESRAVSQP